MHRYAVCSLGMLGGESVVSELLKCGDFVARF